MLIIFKFPCNIFFTTSLCSYSEYLTAFQDKSSLKLSLSGGVSSWMGDLKKYDLLSETKDRKFYFNALSKVQILFAYFTQNKY